LQSLHPLAKRFQTGSKKIMTKRFYVLLDGRGVLSVSGEDRRDFLQGLVSNDMEKVAPDQSVYAAFLSPQGKYLHDFFVVEQGGSFLLDCQSARLGDLKKRLGLYRLRADVSLDDKSDEYAIAALFGDDAAASLGLSVRAGAAAPFVDGLAFVDPRLADVGARAILPRKKAAQVLEDAGFASAAGEAYEALRIGLGLPDADRDMEVGKTTLLESGFDELNGVDWDKGCYLGQELTARTKHRGLLKKRLVPVEIDGLTPPPGTQILYQGKDAGEMRSSAKNMGLALLRLEFLNDSLSSGMPLSAASSKLHPKKPAWANF
jgi:folate-binding protein YgfZ